MSYFKNSILLLKSLYICFLEYGKYKLNIINNVEVINNITTKLSNLNILYTKLLQWIINDTIYFNNEIKKNFEQFTDNVHYDESDIDHTSLLELVNNNKNIKLVSLKPIKSGTISVVYRGILDDNKPIIIKVLKKNIYEKLVESINFFKLLGKISKYIPYISKFNLNNVINNNSNQLLLQTNFIIEANNIEVFYNNFKDNTNIIIPNVYKQFTVENNNIIVIFLI